MKSYKELTIYQGKNLLSLCHPRGGGDPVSYFNFEVVNFNLDSRFRGNDSQSNIMRMLNKLISSVLRTTN